MSRAPRVLVAHDRAGAVAGRIRAALPGTDIVAAETAEAALDAEAEVAFVIVSKRFDRDFHRRLLAQPQLRWLQVGGSGYDHVGAWDPATLAVTNCAGILAPFLAETCMGAMLALNHNLFGYRDQQRARVWRSLPFRPLRGQRLLIVGMGEIGARFGALARAAGMRVVGLKRDPAPMAGADEVRALDALAESLADADVVSLHLRLTPQTRGIIGAREFAAMAKGALFLNTARGALVDETALLAALDDRLGGAHLDVFATEPLPEASPLWRHPKVFLTPHAADGTVDWEDRFADFFADNLTRWRAGETLHKMVQPA